LRAIFTDRKVLSWALYDWANSVFATTVLAGFFPAFFKQYWSAGVAAGTSTFQLGVGHSLASALIVIMAPVLGAIADAGTAKKRFLGFFALLGITMTASLYWIAQGDWLFAIGVFVLGNVGFAAANSFYDALIVDVTEPQQLDVVSAYGYALGYLGGGVLFSFNVATVVWPDWFGFTSVEQAIRVSFLLVAAWWFVFSIPLMLNVPEPRPETRIGTGQAIRAGFRQLFDTFREIRKLRVVLLFLVAYWLYIDGVHTIMRMAVDYGMALGFEMKHLLTALLITQFVAFPAALAFGFLADRIGARAAIMIGILVYILLTVWAGFMDHIGEFYQLAVVIGLVQGGVQSLSRSLYARIIPANKSAEYFGFYNMLGKFAAILGPLMVGLASLATGSPRLSLMSIVVLFVAGGLLLYFVDEREGARIARELA
jgi:UMF1 family MFS transporter